MKYNYQEDPNLGSQIGLQLRRARKIRNLELEEVAEKIGIPPQKLRDMELDEFDPNEIETHLLTKLGDIYQCSASFFLHQDKDFGKDDLPGLIDKAITDAGFHPNLDTRLSIWNYADLCSTGTWIQKDMGILAEMQIPDFEQIAIFKDLSSLNPVAYGKEQAKRIFENVFINEKNIGQINTNEIIQRHNVWTPECSLPHGIRALVVQNPEIGKAVFVNGDRSVLTDSDKQNFHLHGFGYILSNCVQEYDETKIHVISSNFEDNLEENSFSQEFLRNRSFANSFLECMEFKHPYNSKEFEKKMLSLIKQAYYHEEPNTGISRGRAIEIGRAMGMSRDEIMELTYPNR